jgi:dihydrofolate synthase/folylpolyglutamate synthase
VAGTAGKGSTATMLATILRENGLKVGLYTSPHLVKLNERFKINNKDISDKELIKTVNKIKLVIPTNPAKPERGGIFKDQVESKDPSTSLGMTGGLIPSYFEILTTIAFQWFAQEKIDVAVLEVGMGGKWDATNIVNNKISVLTNVGLDHTEFLGRSVEKIAREKVAILKKNGVLITNITQSSVIKIVKNYAKKINAKIIFAKKTNHKTGLLGLHQTQNASLAVEAAKQFDPKISLKIIKRGLLKAFIPGRLEIKKNIVLDGAHNPIKMKA